MRTAVVILVDNPDRGLAIAFIQLLFFWGNFSPIVSWEFLLFPGKFYFEPKPNLELVWVY